MDLNLTWDPVPGVNVIYTVEYRIYLSGDPFTAYSTSVSTNHITITGLPRNFYETRVKANCDPTYIYDTGGEDPCQLVIIGSYSIIETTDAYQKIKFNFTNILPTGATLRVTNTNTSTAILTQVVAASPGNITITLPKTAGETTGYKVEISNNCPSIVWQLVANFTLVGPPPKIITSFKLTTDFCSSPFDNAATCSKPTTGVRFVFSEPLPQAVTITFDYYYENCTGSYPLLAGWASDKQLHKNYNKIHIPAGVTTYGKCFYRDGGDWCGIHKVCIVKVQPATFSNGKVLKFDNAATCIPIKNIPISNFIDAWGGCQYQS